MIEIFLLFILLLMVIGLPVGCSRGVRAIRASRAARARTARVTTYADFARKQAAGSAVARPRDTSLVTVAGDGRGARATVSALHLAARSTTRWKSPDVLVDFSNADVPIGGTLSWYDWQDQNYAGSITTGEHLTPFASTVSNSKGSFTGLGLRSTWSNPFVVRAGYRESTALAIADAANLIKTGGSTGGLNSSYNRLSEFLYVCRTSGATFTVTFAPDTAAPGGVFTFGGTKSGSVGVFPDAIPSGVMDTGSSPHLAIWAAGTSYLYVRDGWYLNDVDADIPYVSLAGKVLALASVWQPADALVLGGRTRSVYLNGTLVGRAFAASLPLFNGDHLRSGNPGVNFAGTLLEARVYGAALEPAEIADLYATKQLPMVDALASPAAVYPTPVLALKVRFPAGVPTATSPSGISLGSVTATSSGTVGTGTNFVSLAGGSYLWLEFGSGFANILSAANASDGHLVVHVWVAPSVWPTAPNNMGVIQFGGATPTGAAPTSGSQLLGTLDAGPGVGFHTGSSVTAYGSMSGVTALPTAPMCLTYVIRKVIHRAGFTDYTCKAFANGTQVGATRLTGFAGVPLAGNRIILGRCFNSPDTNLTTFSGNVYGVDVSTTASFDPGVCNWADAGMVA